MLKRRFRLPSPALVIALIALFAALGGTSLAATKVITAKHKDKKADIKLVKKLAPSLSVKHAKTANSATTAATAANATHATSADSATNATNATNASTVGGLSASQLQKRVSGTCTAGSAVRAVNSDGTVTCQAPTLDGPAVEMGNMQGPIADFCAVGAPSGVSTATNCNADDAATVSAPLPAGAVITDLNVTVSSAVLGDTDVGVADAFAGEFQLFCTIPAGNTSCTAAGPSSTLSAGLPIIFISDDPSQTNTSFSYRLVTPGVTPAAAPKKAPRAFFRR